MINNAYWGIDRGWEASGTSESFHDHYGWFSRIHVTVAPPIDDRLSTRARETGRRTDPLRLFPDGLTIATRRERRPQRTNPVPGLGDRLGSAPTAATSPAAQRQRAQLPPFAPLLEELEIAGWSSARCLLSGNFHDWMLLGGDQILVTVGHATIEGSTDPMEAALVAQAVWAAIRAQASHASEAGAILTLASQSLWTAPAASPASVAVALVDAAGGRASVALAGDCLGWRVRAATCERIAMRQPLLGGAPGFTYFGCSFDLSLRERLLLVADDPLRRSPKVAASLADCFSRLDAESHRRMAAADAVALARQVYERDADREPALSASIAVVRRR
jgi:hypothetical protein